VTNTAISEKKVKDVMISLDQYPTISAEATLQEALVTLSKAQKSLNEVGFNYRAILVLDEHRQVIGKLSFWAILRSLEPKLLSKNDVEALRRTGLSLDYIDTLAEKGTLFPSNLNRLCHEAARVKAREAMIPAQTSIDEQALLTEAIHLLVMTHSQSLLVTKDGTITGILRLSDVFAVVADIIITLPAGC